MEDSELNDEYQEIENLVKEGKSVLWALRENKQIGKVIKQMKNNEKSNFFNLSEAQYLNILFSEIKKTKKINYKNFKNYLTLEEDKNYQF